MWNAGLNEAQTGIKIAGRNINNLRYTDDTILMAESEEELKSFLMRVKEESEKAGLKRNKKKNPKIIAPSPITSWQIEGEKAQTVIHFILGGLQNLCSHEIKSHLTLGRKPMTFPVVIYRCDSWIIRKAEGLRIDAFKLWFWRRHLRVPWTVRRSNQSILKEINPEFSLERLMLKLKLQYFGHLAGRAKSLEKTRMLGKTEGGRRGRQRVRWLDGMTDSMDRS